MILKNHPKCMAEFEIKKSNNNKFKKIFAGSINVFVWLIFIKFDRQFYFSLWQFERVKVQAPNREQQICHFWDGPILINYEVATKY